MFCCVYCEKFYLTTDDGENIYGLIIDNHFYCHECLHYLY